ncbi:MAG TPA: ribonuclease HII [Chloroflexota bacterium]|nr:ribonuclease HII [Chloroflexota bacterium]
MRVVGVDDVGLGPICGPVLACAVLLPSYCGVVDGVRDSKQLSAAQRERLVPRIRAQALAIGIGAASVSEIERLNVRRASHLAMRRALARIGAYDHALVDGLPIRDVDLGPHSTIVDADAQCYSVACASVIAKVTRDRLMEGLARHFPSYGWERNAGYGTREHLLALREHGITPYHRREFAPIRDLVTPEAGDEACPDRSRIRVGKQPSG